MKKIIYLLLLAVIFASCAKTSDTPDPTQNKEVVIQPLGVGYTWEYSDSTFSETGQLIKVEKSQLGITGKITKQFEGKATDMYFWNWFDETTQQYKNPKWLCNNEEGGFYYFGGIADTIPYIFEKTLAVKYPAKVGDTWEKINYGIVQSNNVTAFRKQSTSKIVCKSVDTLFQTGKEKIKCYKYQLFNPYYNTSEVYVLYAPNIGFVGYVKKTNGVVVYKKSLVSYDLTKSSKTVGFKMALTGDEHSGKVDFYGVTE